MANILLIDDEPVSLEILRLSVSGAQHDVHLAASFDEGLTQAATMRSVDVAVIDKNLGRESGLELIRRLRNRGCDAEFIVVTACPTTESAVEAVQLGIHDYMRKPFPDPKVLATQIGEAAARARRRRAQERYQQAVVSRAERLALAAQGSAEGLWDWRPGGAVVYFSGQWKRLLGYPLDAPINTMEAWLDCILPEEREVVAANLQAFVDGRHDALEIACRAHRQDGRQVWLLTRGTAVRDSQRRALRVVGSTTDITERKEIEQQLFATTFFDAVTGLLNQRGILERLRTVLAGPVAGDESLTLLAIEFDNYERAQDGLGRDASEELLRLAARRLGHRLSGVGALAHLGGGCFAVLFRGCTTQVDAQVALARRAMAETFLVGGQALVMAVSAGVVDDLGRPGQEPQEALAAAQRAKNRARAGREGERLVRFEPKIAHQARQRLALESELRSALERREFVCHFQPVVALGGWGIVGFEALLRWQHPRRGLLLPGAFLEAAVEGGIIVALDRIALSLALEQLILWDAVSSALPTVAVNISAGQLQFPGFHRQVAELLAQYGVAPERLTLELTEQVFAEESVVSRDNLMGLTALGIGLALDDFGTGYSSLSYLSRFPFEHLKIDRAFVQDVCDGGRAEALVRAIVGIGEALKMTVTAEGIETAGQRDLLASLACHYGQGWLFGRPVSGAEAGALLA